MSFSDSAKYQILLRFEVQVQCALCTNWFALRGGIEFDHIHATCIGGPNHPDNGRPLCDLCHKKKRNKTSKPTPRPNESFESVKVLGDLTVHGSIHVCSGEAPSGDGPNDQ